MISLSSTDKEIIKLLQQDGRMSFVEMAERIGVTEGTIRRKFYRLGEELSLFHILPGRQTSLCRVRWLP